MDISEFVQAWKQLPTAQRDEFLEARRQAVNRRKSVSQNIVANSSRLLTVVPSLRGCVRTGSTCLTVARKRSGVLPAWGESQGNGTEFRDQHEV